MRVCIHRGTKEIGGNCIELESAGRHILLDLGMPLTTAKPDEVELPDIRGLKEGIYYSKKCQAFSYSAKFQRSSGTTVRLTCSPSSFPADKVVLRL